MASPNLYSTATTLNILPNSETSSHQTSGRIWSRSNIAGVEPRFPVTSRRAGGPSDLTTRQFLTANASGGLAITLLDMSSFGGNGGGKPATGITWNEAARFVNWMNTSEGFSPAYKFAIQPGDAGYSSNDNIQLWQSGDPGFDLSNPFRNSLAKYVLPTFDEWYKAAYYDPVSDEYFDYPNGSNTAPIKVAGGTTDNTEVYAQKSSQGPAFVTTAGGLSPFGVMGLGGNVREYQESETDLVNDSPSGGRAVRGVAWFEGSTGMSRTNIGGTTPNSTTGYEGFRVASLSASAVPEPSTMVSLASLLGIGLAYRIRRVRARA